MVGSILGGRYEVLERIGTGGMSLVYRARDITLNRLVAVKILKHQWAEDDEVVRRFDQEARAAASLTDRHIVQVYDVGRDEPDVHYMVMELVAGETLRAKLNREAPLPVNEALMMADQVAAGLEVAHDKKLVHRDIKPQNILITENGTVKVTDFGIAYAATTGTLVNTGSLLGTVQYLSPEQARGKLIGPQSDVYSLGVVMFEMLTGKLPFESDSAIGVAIKHLQDDPPDVKTLRPDVPLAVDALVKRALSKDPSDRHQSVHALRQDIGRILDPGKAPAEVSLVEAPPGGLPAEGDEGTRGKRPPKTGFRRWLPWLIGLAVILLLVGGGVYAFQRWLNPPTVMVPNIQGKSLKIAQSRARAKGLMLDVVGHASSATMPKNFVLHESPNPGTTVKSGQPIEVVVSSGPTMKLVPLMKGEDVFQAKQELKTLNLKPTLKHVASNRPGGQVVRQSPAAGKSIPSGSHVTLWVSNGPKQVSQTMPNMVGLTVSEAASELIGLNVTVGSPSDQYSTEPVNTIIDQNPAPYASLKGVSQVGVTISTGPSPESASLPRNVSTPTWSVPSSAAPKSVLKVVITDQAGNEEVYYQQVNPGKTVEFPIVWYGNTGQLLAYLNGQAAPPEALTPNSPSPTSASSSTSSSSPSSQSSAPSSNASGD